jgi:chromosome segregation ATPase
MDDRTKTILALEQKRTDEAGRIDRLLRGLGQLLLERSDDDSLSAERVECGNINDELAQLDEAVLQVERGDGRVHAIDAEIVEAERLNREMKAQLAALHAELGKLAVEDEAFSAFALPYKTRIADIQQKIGELSGRLNERGEPGETKETRGANVFAWIGRGAQNLVVKVSLAKTQSSLERVYAEAGTAFAHNRPVGQTGSADTEAVYAEAESLRREGDERDLRIIALKEEKRTILSSFGREGSASRRKAEIARRKEQLQQDRDRLSLRLGKRAVSSSESSSFLSLFDDEMSRIGENVAHHREQVKDYEARIAGIKALMEIDRERAEVKKLEQSIAEQRRRIALAEEAIARHEMAVNEANRRIEQLTARQQGSAD